MNREAKLWLFGAGGVAVVVLAVVLIFGLNFAPEFPNLYEEDGPTIQGTVAYMQYEHDDCVNVLDVGTGEAIEPYCDDWLWLEGWDQDGNLQILRGGGHSEELLTLDPDTGAVLDSGEFRPDEDPRPEQPVAEAARRIRVSSQEGHATLSYRSGDSETILIDVDGSRVYGFGEYGVSADEKYAWTCDSEHRLLVVALDGTSGPWVVAEDVSELRWK